MKVSTDRPVPSYGSSLRFIATTLALGGGIALCVHLVGASSSGPGSAYAVQPGATVAADARLEPTTTQYYPALFPAPSSPAETPIPTF